MKLQSVMQHNPRRLRPSLKAQNKTNKKPTNVKLERVKTERSPSTEVWQVDSESEVELMASAEPTPEVAWVVSAVMHSDVMISVLSM